MYALVDNLKGGDYMSSLPEQRDGSMFSPVSMRGTARRARHFRGREQLDSLPRLVMNRKLVRPKWEQKGIQEDYERYMRGLESQRKVAELLHLLQSRGSLRFFFETEQWSLADVQGVDFWGELRNGRTFKVDAVSSEERVWREYEKHEGEDILVFTSHPYHTREEDATRLLQELNDFFNPPGP